MQYLAESVKCNLFKEFVTEKCVYPYRTELDILAELKLKVTEKNVIESQKYFAEMLKASSNLVSDLESYINTYPAEVENVKFWIQFLDMMNVVHDLLHAECEGIWELHFDAVQ